MKPDFIDTIVPFLLVICGPTAAGKTGLSLAIADRLMTIQQSAVILSADSRQVYRHFDIGTAKPAIADQQQAPHYLIDICEPTETLTLAEYQENAQRLIAKFHAESTVPLLVGGTGLYIRSVIRGLKIPAVPPHPELRSQLADLGQPFCHQLLQQVDPPSAQRIHPNDQVRTLRALEIYYVTGETMSDQQGENPPDYPILQIGLDCFEPGRLRDRIQQRTIQMMQMGFVDEVRSLQQRFGSDLPLLNTLGYQEVAQYLAGDISYEDAIELTVQHTRQFAKRQRTWFRADPSIHWFDSEAADLIERVWTVIQGFVSNLGEARGVRSEE